MYSNYVTLFSVFVVVIYPSFLFNLARYHESAAQMLVRSFGGEQDDDLDFLSPSFPSLRVCFLFRFSCWLNLLHVRGTFDRVFAGDTTADAGDDGKLHPSGIITEQAVGRQVVSTEQSRGGS